MLASGQRRAVHRVAQQLAISCIAILPQLELLPAESAEYAQLRACTLARIAILDLSERRKGEGGSLVLDV